MTPLFIFRTIFCILFAAVNIEELDLIIQLFCTQTKRQVAFVVTKICWYLLTPYANVEDVDNELPLIGTNVKVVSIRMPQH